MSERKSGQGAVQSKKSLVPMLRFSEFEGVWDEVSLGDVAEFRRGSFPQPYGRPEWFDDNGVPFVQVYDVDDNFRLKQATKQKISAEAARQSVFVPQNTVVVTIQGSIGRIAITQYDSYVDRTLLIFTGYRIPIDVQFFAKVMFLLFEIEKRKAPGGTIKTITKSALSNFRFLTPRLPEQKKIAAFLGAVDEKLAALRQRRDLLTRYKRGLMQKLFSQTLRFTGDDGTPFPDWQEKRLGEVCSINPDSPSLPNKFFYIDLESVKKGRLFNYAEVARGSAPSRAQRWLQAGDILFQTVRPYQKNNLLFNLQGDFVASTGYAQIRSRNHSKYLYQYLHHEAFVTEVIRRCTGTSYPAINSNDLDTIIISFPHPDEQQKIADALQAMDAKIEAVAAEVDQIETFKKALLQQMFV